MNCRAIFKSPYGTELTATLYWKRGKAMTQITLEIPEYYSRELEFRAKKRQKTLQEIILEAVRKFMEDEEKNINENVPNAFEVLERLSGTVEAPYDWAANHDHYLYGTPRKNEARA
jgi:hypothetical protein